MKLKTIGLEIWDDSTHYQSRLAVESLSDYNCQEAKKLLLECGFFALPIEVNSTYQGSHIRLSAEHETARTSIYFQGEPLDLNLKKLFNLYRSIWAGRCPTLSILIQVT